MTKLYGPNRCSHLPKFVTFHGGRHFFPCVNCACPEIVSRKVDRAEVCLGMMTWWDHGNTVRVLGRFKQKSSPIQNPRCFCKFWWKFLGCEILGYIELAHQSAGKSKNVKKLTMTEKWFRFVMIQNYHQPFQFVLKGIMLMFLSGIVQFHILHVCHDGCSTWMVPRNSAVNPWSRGLYLLKYLYIPNRSGELYLGFSPSTITARVLLNMLRLVSFTFLCLTEFQCF